MNPAGVVIVGGAVLAGVTLLLPFGRRLAEGATIKGAWRCRNRHAAPVRHPLGGFRCAACGVSSADLGGLGYDSHADLPRRTFDRDAKTTTRTDALERGRGGW